MWAEQGDVISSTIVANHCKLFAVLVQSLLNSLDLLIEKLVLLSGPLLDRLEVGEETGKLALHQFSIVLKRDHPGKAEKFADNISSRLAWTSVEEFEVVFRLPRYLPAHADGYHLMNVRYIGVAVDDVGRRAGIGPRERNKTGFDVPNTHTVQT